MPNDSILQVPIFCGVVVHMAVLVPIAFEVSIHVSIASLSVPAPSDVMLDDVLNEQLSCDAAWPGDWWTPAGLEQPWSRWTYTPHTGIHCFGLRLALPHLGRQEKPR